jgi:Zn-dependent protease
LGIPIKLHISWFLLAALLTWSLASGYFPQTNPGWTAATYWAVGASASILFFASVLLHELGHSVLALREKVPVKSITLFVFGGVAQIGREPPTAGAEFRIAIAGPLTSLGLAGIFAGLGVLLTDVPTVSAPLAYLGTINLILALFNMIPGFPLDGGRVLRAALWQFGGSFRNATKWATRAGQASAFLFIGVGVLQFIFGGFSSGLWWAFIGWYLYGAAQSSFRQVKLQDALAGVKAGNVTMQQCVPVSGDVRLDRLVEDHVLTEDQRCFLVGEGDNPAGLITLDGLRAVSGARRRGMTANQIMIPVAAMEPVDVDDDAWNLVRRMGEEGIGEIPVSEKGRILGLVTQENLWNHVRLRSELAA